VKSMKNEKSVLRTRQASGQNSENI
jgi:hypothetical protein